MFPGEVIHFQKNKKGNMSLLLYGMHYWMCLLFFDIFYVYC